MLEGNGKHEVRAIVWSSSPGAFSPVEGSGGRGEGKECNFVQVNHKCQLIVFCSL